MFIMLVNAMPRASPATDFQSGRAKTRVARELAAGKTSHCSCIQKGFGKPAGRGSQELPQRQPSGHDTLVNSAGGMLSCADSPKLMVPFFPRGSCQ